MTNVVKAEDLALPMPQDYAGTVAMLAELPSLEYEAVRLKEAKRLGVRVVELDKVVRITRASLAQEQGAAAGILIPEPDVWPEPVDLADVLTEIYSIINKFIVCDNNTAVAATLWVSFTWVINHVQVAPLAVITAPEPRCGKTQMLDLLGRLSRRSLVASNISPAAVFRVIEASKPTLLIDEADSFLRENEELRGVINSGHTRQSAYVIRTVGDDHIPQRFSTWGAKALSGIGHLQSTLMDRAVVLELRRKLKTEEVERLRHADPEIFLILAAKLARFAVDAGVVIGAARPHLPEELNDRAQDNWEPLIAIADHAGGEWPSKARDAALKLAAAEHEPLGAGTQLLLDLREVFEMMGGEKLTTAEILKAITSDEEKGWATYDRGRPLTAKGLAHLLKGYGIHSKDLNIGPTTRRKGYSLKQLQPIFERYLPLTEAEKDAAVDGFRCREGG